MQKKTQYDGTKINFTQDNSFAGVYSLFRLDCLLDLGSLQEQRDNNE